MPAFIRLGCIDAKSGVSAPLHKAWTRDRRKNSFIAGQALVRRSLNQHPQSYVFWIHHTAIAALVSRFSAPTTRQDEESLCFHNMAAVK